MTSKDLPYYLSLSQVQGIGPARFKILLDYFEKAEKVWKAPSNVLKEVLEPNIFRVFEEYRVSVSPEKVLQKLLAKKINFTTLLDENYPTRLKEISVPPPVLYFQGSLESKDELAVAVVGTRKITSYGREVTENLVEQLVSAGLTIVSGLAKGVDSTAHLAALKNKGRTFAVLGSGVDVIYPTENTKLAGEIAKHGALISEFPPGLQPTPGNFPARNRIISGLSLGVIVTEADEKSGSLITAAYGLEQNREVFAVPGPIYSQFSKGPASLIKQGAKLVTSAQDVLDELNLEKQVLVNQAKKVVADSPEEEIILKLLENEQKHVDQIIRESGLNSNTLAGLLTTMELKGKVKSLGGGTYGLGH